MAKNNDKLTDVQTAALRKIAQVIAKEKVRIENEPHLQELAAERGVPLVATTWANEMTITGVYRIRRATLEVLETKGYVERRWSDGQGRQVRPTAKAASIIDPAPAPVAEATPAPAPVVPPAPVAEATPAPTGDPVKTTRTFTHDLRGGVVMTSDAYTTDGKVWFWSSVDRPVPLDAAKDYNIPIDPVAQKAAIDAHLDKVVAAYRKARENYVPSDEHMAEMRAAFGPGRDVVDVITGQRFRT